MTSQISAFEAKTRFGELLARVAKGEEIVITKHEKPVARLIPEGRQDLSDIREAVEASKRLQQSMLKHGGFRPITDKEIRAAKQEGRR
ncbi:MAG: type II toxin-antitoxin system prevent-host-death family antitoxin [Bryobacterales bacterium]|nr:type II toxin-antitoxin system prevent-host-death family antitoxin [Bryobacterales bacterium]